MVYASLSCFLQAFLSGRPGCFRVLAVVNSVATSTGGTRVSLARGFSGRVPSGGTAGP